MKLLNLLQVSSLLLFTLTAANAETVYHNDRKDNTIVELYTSQGCSSCPPAERWLGKLQDDPRLWKTLFPIAFHVDYWDYIGWKDIFANSLFSQRQRQYKSENAIASVYTPGFVVNGKEWRGWFSRKSLPETQTTGELKATLNQQLLKAEYIPDNEQKNATKLHVAIIATGLETKIARGENSGKILTQDFTVIHYQTDTSSTRHWQLNIPRQVTQGNARYAMMLWVSQNNSQKPLQVAGGWINR